MYENIKSVDNLIIPEGKTLDVFSDDFAKAAEIRQEIDNNISQTIVDSMSRKME